MDVKLFRRNRNQRQANDNFWSIHGSESQTRDFLFVTFPLGILPLQAPCKSGAPIFSAAPKPGLRFFSFRLRARRVRIEIEDAAADHRGRGLAEGGGAAQLDFGPAGHRGEAGRSGGGGSLGPGMGGQDSERTTGMLQSSAV